MGLQTSLLGRLNNLLQPGIDRSPFRTADGIVLFVHTVLRVKDIAPYQEDVLRAIVDHRRVSVRAPHGAGKSTTAAWIVLWAVSVFDVDVKAVTTAGAWRQLIEFLWPEIRKWAARADWNLIGLEVRRGKELLDLSLTIGENRAFAVASDNPALIEGAHASIIVYVFDESKSIAADTWDAAEGAFSTGEAYALGISTPGEPSGRFYDIQSRKPGYEDWWVRHITLQECIDAGRINPEWVEKRQRQWGETSAVYQNRVLGEFADSSEDNVIPLSWVERSNERWHDLNGKGEGAVSIGADIARFGDDKTELAREVGRVVEIIQEYSKQDTMETTGHVVAFVGGKKDIPIAVDVIGIGAGVFDRLHEQGYQAIAVNVSERTTIVDKSGVAFFNLRSLVWWMVREALDPQGDILLALPPDDQLTGDLTAPTWTLTSEGRRKVESKDDIKKRIGRSTDKGDSVCLAHYAATMIGTVLIDWVEPDPSQQEATKVENGVLFEADDHLLEGDDPSQWAEVGSWDKFRW